MERIAQILLTAFLNGNKVLICGNGGSAALSQHFTAELLGKFKKIRKPLPAIDLTSNSAFVSAWSNDVDFCDVFSRQVEAFGIKGDVVIGISTSGKSINVLEALQKARDLSLVTIDFPRKGKTTQEIQEYQLKLMHQIVEEIEETL